MSVTGMNEKNKGNAAFAEGKFAEAEEWYSQAIRIDPTEKTFWGNRASALGKQRLWAQSLEDARKCVELDPSWYKGHYRMGEALMSLKQYAQAREALALAVAKGPTGDPTLKGMLDLADQAITEKMKKREEKEKKYKPEPPRTEPSPRRVERPYTGAPKIGSMEEYKKFRAQGGGQLTGDGVDRFVEEAKAYEERERAEMLAHPPLEAKFDGSSSGPTSAGSPAASPAKSSGGNRSELMAKREELLRSMGLNPASPVGTAGAGATAGGGGGGAGGASLPGSVGLDSSWGKIRGSDTQPDSTPTKERYRTSELLGDADVGNREDFIQRMGLDTRGADYADYGYTAPKSTAGGAGSPGGGFSPPTSTTSTASYLQSSPAVRGSAMAAPQTPSGHSSHAPGAGGSAGAAEQEGEAPLPRFDYAAAGASLGEGTKAKESWMSSYRSKVGGEVPVGVDERMQKAQKMGNFSYRRFGENKDRVDLLTNHRVMDDAIFAEAMGEYISSTPTRRQQPH